MIEVHIDDNEEKERMELTFKQGRATWVTFLNDSVREDPDQLAGWLKTLIKDLQYKKGA